MAKVLVMDKKPVKKSRKRTRRHLHHSKNALKMHARHCYDPSNCTYGKEFGADARQLNDQGVLHHHMEICAPLVKDLGANQAAKIMIEKCTCWKRLQNYSCEAAVDAENASAEIERHLAAIRKIKRRGKSLKGKEGYAVYPE